MTLLAFHNDPKIKQKFLRRVRAHKRADAFMQGIYFEKHVSNKMIGCAIGCTLELDPDANMIAISTGPYSVIHGQYESQLGIPAQLAMIEDCVFEALSLPYLLDWPEEFLMNINVGADLSEALREIMMWLVEDPIFGLKTTVSVDELTHTLDPGLLKFDFYLSKVLCSEIDETTYHTIRNLLKTATKYFVADTSNSCKQNRNSQIFMEAFCEHILTVLINTKRSKECLKTKPKLTNKKKR